MSFVGQVNRLGDALRPAARRRARCSSPTATGRREAMVERVVHLGFEVRVELVRDDGQHLTRSSRSDEAEQLELARGQIVYVAAEPRDDRSVRRPGLRVGSDPADLVRQPARGDVGERHRLEHGAQVAAHGDPDLAQRLGAPAYSSSSGRSPRTFASGPSTARMTSASEISAGGLRQPVAALGAALARTRPGVLQVEQDVLEELQRDLLRRGDALALDRALARGRRELGARAHGVVDLRGDSHAGEI